jgi:hypothetical protein
MSAETINRLEEAVNKWHQRRKTELEAEASFLEKALDSGDAVSMAESLGGERYSDLIADTIAELTS